MKYSQIVNIESNDNYKSEDLIHKKFIELICDSIYKIYTVYLYACVAHQDAALSTYLEWKICFSLSMFCIYFVDLYAYAW